MSSDRWFLMRHVMQKILFKILFVNWKEKTTKIRKEGFLRLIR
ncbi:hypothetical protein AIOGIFDO_01344 [Candidatus Methanoperedenaceae archaeon GB37]|nr:hypothetical protein AIOGIFDO_01344 [Candidatus Methanoperedenaceae archaeon GB37]